MGLAPRKLALLVMDPEMFAVSSAAAFAFDLSGYEIAFIYFNPPLLRGNPLHKQPLLFLRKPYTAYCRTAAETGDFGSLIRFQIKRKEFHNLSEFRFRNS